MIWSGLLIYWANDVYRIGFGDQTLIKFFPDSFYSAFKLGHMLATGMSFHFLFMWIFALNGSLYVMYTVFSGQWKYLVPRKNSFGDAWMVLKHDLFLSREKPPKQKFNGAQQIAYTGIIIMGVGSLLSGLAIYKPIQLSGLCALMGGYTFARIIHFALTIGYVLFFIIHVLQVIRAGWKNFSAMVTGFEVVDEKEVNN